MTDLRAAVVGTGFIGPVHVEGLRRAGVDVVGILGSTPAKSQAAADQLRIGTAYATYAELLADDRVDVVHLTTPNRFHHAEALAALDSGKHVLCEKPLAMTARESAELVVRAEQSERFCGVNYNVRFYPLCQEARARVAVGELGRLFHVAGSYVQDWLLYDTDFNWRVLANDGGELRAMADIGTHWLDLVQFVTGQRIVAVCADLQTAHTTRRRPVGGVETFSDARDRGATEPVAITTDDYGALLLQLESGARGVMWVSQVTAGRKNCLRFEISGEQSSVAWNSETPNELWLGRRSEANRMLLKDPSLLSPAARKSADYPGGHNEGFPDTFKQLFRTFYAAIRTGDRTAATAYPTFADGHREIVLCEAILRSHRERQWVDVIRD